MDFASAPADLHKLVGEPKGSRKEATGASVWTGMASQAPSGGAHTRTTVSTVQEAGAPQGFTREGHLSGEQHSGMVAAAALDRTHAVRLPFLVVCCAPKGEAGVAVKKHFDLRPHQK